jgi:hypothetical protein
MPAVVTLRETSLGFVCLYLMAILPRLLSFSISWDFDVLGKVIRKREMCTVVSSARDPWVVDICLTLITSKPRFTNPSEMFSAGAEAGRYSITVSAGFCVTWKALAV